MRCDLSKGPVNVVLGERLEALGALGRQADSGPEDGVPVESIVSYRVCHCAWLRVLITATADVIKVPHPRWYHAMMVVNLLLDRAK